MTGKTATIALKKRIALVAHDHKKADLLEWARFNQDTLAQHAILSTGTTGLMLGRELGLSVISLQSGPLGGDQQIGARIAEGEIDLLIFFWDPLESLPHDPDVKALLRIAMVWNIPVACNRASADFIFSSPLIAETYQRQLPDYEGYKNRRLETGKRGRKYNLLSAFLQKRSGEETGLTLPFEHIEAILERNLPDSARKYREWWANHEGNSQAQGWLSAGWKVDSVDLMREMVTFIRG